MSPPTSFVLSRDTRPLDRHPQGEKKGGTTESASLWYIYTAYNASLRLSGISSSALASFQGEKPPSHPLESRDVARSRFYPSAANPPTTLCAQPRGKLSPMQPGWTFLSRLRRSPLSLFHGAYLEEVRYPKGKPVGISKHDEWHFDCHGVQEGKNIQLHITEICRLIYATQS